MKIGTQNILKHSLTIISLGACGQLLSADFNYPEALQKSIFFYEAQRAGPLPDGNRVEWRGNSGMDDGKDVGIDLTGGWYDAGDHVKFGLPMASTATLLSLGVLEYRDGYAKFGQLEYILDNIRWVNDYFLKAHAAPHVLWGQVGNGSSDHAFWGAPEVMTMIRPAYKIDESCPGSDLAGETSAAMASASMVFRQTDPAYSSKLLEHAVQLFEFADKFRGTYVKCITDAQGYYNSWSGYQDEIVWAGLWLYKATNDPAYLEKAKLEYEKIALENGSKEDKVYKWTHAWDDKSYGSYLLMSIATGDEKYMKDVERWLDFWTTGYKGEHITYSPGGLAWLSPWGALRYSANTALMAFIYSDFLNKNNIRQEKAAVYEKFARAQIDYMLGENPDSRSYVVGFGNNPPRNPHHRGSHGSWSNNLENPKDNRHILYGALVGGPGSDDKYEDSRKDYVKNEVATDYNAGFTGALAFLSQKHGGSILQTFPEKEKRDDEFFVEAKINSSSERYVEIAAKIYNHSAWPARHSKDLSFKYFVNLSEILKTGYKLSDIKISTAYTQGSGISSLRPWNIEAGIYYVEVFFKDVDIYPGSDSASQKEAQFRFSLPDNATIRWNPSKDPSFKNLESSSLKKTQFIPIYEKGILLWGTEPASDGSSGGDTGGDTGGGGGDTGGDTGGGGGDTGGDTGGGGDERCLISYKIVNQWENGFVAEITIKNQTKGEISDWTATWSWQNGQKITNLWSGDLKSGSNPIMVKGLSWNDIVAKDGSATFGFQATHSGINTNPTDLALKANGCK
ncbi:MAG: glycoside hydrolase family 9 protein [Oligoflexales bacterium]|nr:glycoside hydrolase family 9 protein [Oligoflexales bacterium]